MWKEPLKKPFTEIRVGGPRASTWPHCSLKKPQDPSPAELPLYDGEIPVCCDLGNECPYALKIKKFIELGYIGSDRTVTKTKRTTIHQKDTAFEWPKTNIKICKEQEKYINQDYVSEKGREIFMDAGGGVPEGKDEYDNSQDYQMGAESGEGGAYGYRDSDLELAAFKGTMGPEEKRVRTRKQIKVVQVGLREKVKRNTGRFRNIVTTLEKSDLQNDRWLANIVSRAKAVLSREAQRPYLIDLSPKPKPEFFESTFRTGRSQAEKVGQVWDRVSKWSDPLPIPEPFITGWPKQRLDLKKEIIGMYFWEKPRHRVNEIAQELECSHVYVSKIVGAYQKNLVNLIKNMDLPGNQKLKHDILLEYYLTQQTQVQVGDLFNKTQTEVQRIIAQFRKRIKKKCVIDRL